jgi:uncharacterized protein
MSDLYNSAPDEAAMLVFSCLTDQPTQLRTSPWDNPSFILKLAHATAKNQKRSTPTYLAGIESHGPSNMINTGSAEGIQGNIAAPDQEPKSYVTFYVQVPQIEAALDKIAKLGGKVLVPATEVPGMGQFAWFADLDGGAIGLWKSA